jgi:hypothetical protein
MLILTTCLELIVAHFSLQVAGGEMKGKVQEDGVGVNLGSPKVEISWTIKNHFTKKFEKVLKLGNQKVFNKPSKSAKGRSSGRVLGVELEAYQSRTQKILIDFKH